MKTDLLTLSALITQAIFKIPPVAHLQAVVQINDVTLQRHALQDVLQPLLPHVSETISQQTLDSFYEQEVQRILPQIDSSLFVAQWLLLQSDFHIIKQAYIQARTVGVSSYISTLELSTLRLYAMYEDRLQAVERDLHSIDDTFMFVNALDKVYLHSLLHIAQHSSHYSQSYVDALVYTYNTMTMLRLTQLGKSRPAIITSLLQRVGDYSTDALQNLPDGDVVGGVAKILQLPIERSSIHDIEHALYKKQIQALNMAIFSGGNEDRLLQYFGKLQFFLYDVQLILSGMALQMSPDMISTRLIDYDTL